MMAKLDVSAKWELKMGRQRELRKKGAELLFERVQLLVQCYDDPEFRSFCEQNSIVDLDYMDNELEDTAANFLTLRAVYEAYPTALEWKKHNIRDLIAEVLASTKKTREPGQKQSWKERALAAEKMCEQLRAEIRILEKTIELSGAKSHVS